MPARKTKSLQFNTDPQELHGYGHREHRSRKAQKGLNTTHKRFGRIMKQGIQFKRNRKWRFNPTLY